MLTLYKGVCFQKHLIRGNSYASIKEDTIIFLRPETQLRRHLHLVHLWRFSIHILTLYKWCLYSYFYVLSYQVTLHKRHTRVHVHVQAWMIIIIIIVYSHRSLYIANSLLTYTFWFTVRPIAISLAQACFTSIQCVSNVTAVTCFRAKTCIS